MTQLVIAVLLGLALVATGAAAAHAQAKPDEATDDRILEVADFVAGFCSSHMRIWDAPAAMKSMNQDP